MILIISWELRPQQALSSSGQPQPDVPNPMLPMKLLAMQGAQARPKPKGPCSGHPARPGKEGCMLPAELLAPYKLLQRRTPAPPTAGSTAPHGPNSKRQQQRLIRVDALPSAWFSTSGTLRASKMAAARRRFLRCHPSSSDFHRPALGGFTLLTLLPPAWAQSSTGPRRGTARPRSSDKVPRVERPPGDFVRHAEKPKKAFLGRAQRPPHQSIYNSPRFSHARPESQSHSCGGSSASAPRPRGPCAFRSAALPRPWTRASGARDRLPAWWRESDDSPFIELARQVICSLNAVATHFIWEACPHHTRASSTMIMLCLSLLKDESGKGGCLCCKSARMASTPTRHLVKQP